MSRVLHRTLFADPILATRGEGIFLHTADGRKIIDGSGGAAVACLGHGHPRINAAIAEQLSKVAYVHTVLFTNQVAEELAETLVGHEPGGLSHAYFAPPAPRATKPPLSSPANTSSKSANPSALALSPADKATTATRSALSPLVAT
jgi:hypothetical protein